MLIKVKLTRLHSVNILFTLSQNLLNSKPFLIYSACEPQASQYVKIVNSFTSDRSDNLEVEDRYLRDNIFVTVHTRNIGGPL